MAIYTIHAGHAAPGKKYCGAVGIYDESTEDRKIKDVVIKYLRQDGHTVYDCTVDSGSSQSDIIRKIKAKINSYKGVTANISIHLNSYNTIANGTECCVYSLNGNAATIATRINNKISAMGYKNRGNKERTNLGVLKDITNGGSNILVETFFSDCKIDCDIYKKYGEANSMGKAIAEGIVGHTITTTSTTSTTTSSTNLSPNTVFKGFPHARGHIQSIGWDNPQGQGELVGKIGKRLEAVKIDYPGVQLYAKAHIQSIGDVDYGKITSNTVIGTVGKSKRLEALYLKGKIQFRVYIESMGWTAWKNATNGVWLGTKGKSKAIQAVQFKAL